MEIEDKKHWISEAGLTCEEALDCLYTTAKLFKKANYKSFLMPPGESFILEALLCLSKKRLDTCKG